MILTLGGNARPTSTRHTPFVPPPPNKAEAMHFLPQQRIVHITNPSNRSRDPTPASVSPINRPPKTVRSISTRNFLSALLSSEGFSERQLRRKTAQKVRRLRITFLDRSMASDVDKPIPANSVVLDFLDLCYEQLARRRNWLCFCHGVWSGVELTHLC